MALRHIGWSSRGGPGRTITVGLPGTTTPGAVPTGSSTCEPAGIMACLRLAAPTASKSTPSKRAMKDFRMAAILFSVSASSTSSRPEKRATTSTVMSSAVGPRPPLVMIRSTACSAMKRSCALISAGRSPQIVMCASSTPSSRSRSAIQGPFASCTRPVRTSVPVTTMPARALTGYESTQAVIACDAAGPLRDDVSMIELEVVQADVTTLEVDAITNAANTQLMHAGGVAGAIARAAGPELQRESNEKAPIGLGEAVETTAGDMPARYVIHAATMELGGPTSAEIIARATGSTLRKADELGCRSLALVAFGTGVGGFPLEDAARLMVDAVQQYQPGSLEKVVFAVHGDAAEQAFRAAVRG